MANLRIIIVPFVVLLALPAQAQLRPSTEQPITLMPVVPAAKPAAKSKPPAVNPAQVNKPAANKVPAKSAVKNATAQKPAAVKKVSTPLQLGPQAAPQTKAAPDATPAPALAMPQPLEPQRGGLMRRYDPFTSVQRATLTRINEVYNAAHEMNGIFTQVESGGTASSGRFFITKPGRIRFVYDPPSNLDIVADGTQLAIRDKKLGTQDTYQLWQTPLRYLLKEKIDLIEDARVVSILQDTNVVTVSIDEDVAMTQGRLTLYFSAIDYKLQQWTITDARGVETSVAVAKLEINKPNDQRIFALQ